MGTKGFKIDLTPPFKKELDSVKGGFINVAPFKRKRRSRKPKASRKFGIIDFLPISIFNKGGVVANTKSKFKGHF
tara:strand:+ start:111 stop:335 length:225 start_codon:yes stop_codon:yes gene_type:complete